MNRVATIILMLALWMPTASVADLRELSQSELRYVVSTNNAIATRQLIAGVENFSGGDVVEIRAFLSNDSLTYRVLFRKDDGQLGSIMVDGSSGHAVNNTSETGRRVSRLAADNIASGNATTVVSASSRGNNASSNRTESRRRIDESGNRNSNGGGNGNNGNGNGNGGGNGNGNNGNGNGNGGGNGNGNNGNGNGGGNRGNGKGNR